MTSVIDLWRAVDPEARLVSGSVDGLLRPARGVRRTRAASPHLPPAAEGELLVVDGPLLGGGSLEAMLSTVRAAGLQPAAILVAGLAATQRLERAGDEVPVLASVRSVGPLAESLAAYLRDESGHLERLSADLRLAAAEAALGDPEPGAASGLVAARMRRGVAVIADGEVRALHARPAGRALAARFVAAHTRFLGGGARDGSSRRTRDGLWLLERGIRTGAAVWFFDDLPFARVDDVAAEALGVTLRALLRRTPAPRGDSRPNPRMASSPPVGKFGTTLLAVARSNGRIAPAARSLGVHRNTVLYRLRVASAEHGLDPRRPADALRILADAEGPNR